MVEKKRVLVADDDEAIQICLEDISQEEGWTLTFASDGEDCLRKIQQEAPSLLILDQRMPKMTGEEVLKRLEKQGRRLPVILVSAEKDLTRFRHFSSIVQVLNKPFELDDFVGLVNRQLAQQV